MFLILLAKSCIYMSVDNNSFFTDFSQNLTPFFVRLFPMMLCYEQKLTLY